ncbi:MAG TPA: PCRF domain-containing protein, partial [Candidatus Paceibacterota bacterium]|nr:PCRF domain-containing protein [Candidatus Paceibacterota bacterium]
MDISQFKQNHKTAYLAESYERVAKEEAELLALMATDVSMKDLGAAELASFAEQKATLWKQMETIVNAGIAEEEYPNEIILEIRAGAGGDEAALFAEQLAHIYKNFALKKGWTFQVVDESQSSLGGYKEASFEISGKDVYKTLRFETGVHRIQRVPATEKSGRVHTSTAVVAILPIRKKFSFEINPA